MGEGEGEGMHHDGGTPARSMSLLQQQKKVRKYWHIYVTYTYVCNFASTQILRTMNMHALSVSSTMCKVQEIVNLPAHDFLLYVVIHMQQCGIFPYTVDEGNLGMLNSGFVCSKRFFRLLRC